MTNACGIAVLSDSDARSLELVTPEEKTEVHFGSRKELTMVNIDKRKKVQSFLDDRLKPFMEDTHGSLFGKLDGVSVGSAFDYLDCSIARDYVAIKKRDLDVVLEGERKNMAGIGKHAPIGILDKAGSFVTMEDVCVDEFEPKYRRVCDMFRRRWFDDFKDEILPRIDDDDWLVAFTFHR